MTHLIYEKSAENPKNVNRGLAFPVGDLLAITCLSVFRPVFDFSNASFGCQSRLSGNGALCGLTVISQEIVRLNVEVPEDLQDRLKIHAIKTKSTVKEIVQAVLEKNIPRYDG